MINNEDYKEEFNADVVVVGGGSAGVGAAVAAARKGLNVYLLEPSDLLGGIIAKSFGMPIAGAYPRGESIGGVCEEWINRLYESDSALRRECLLKGFEDEVVYDPDVGVFQLFELCVEAGVKILLNATAIDVVMDGNKVNSVIYYDRGGRHIINTKLVIDCSGDGDIAAKAGVPFVKGDEKGDMMGATLTFFMKNVDVEKVFTNVEDPFRRDLVKKGIEEGKLHEDMYNIYMMRGHREGTVFFNCVHIKGIDGTSVSQLREGTIEARKRAFQLIKFVQEEVPGFETAKVESMAPTLGVRETRRFEGMYKLLTDDLLQGRKFKDGIVSSDCTIDDVLRGKDSEVIHISLVDDDLSYQIPYGSLCPKEITNVLFAGRNISAETLAFASARSIATSMVMGQACGTAANLAIKNNIPVQEVDGEELVEDLVKQGVNGIGEKSLNVS